MIQKSAYSSPIGKIWITAEKEKIVELFLENREKREREEDYKNLQEYKVLKTAKKQLEEYFSGKRKEFHLPLELKGTDFQKKVWEALQKIPYGQTRSYGELAEIIGKPKASRAVGGANHRNPIMIFVPCHRVIGANGDLVGFGSGIEVKRYLLELEKKYR